MPPGDTNFNITASMTGGKQVENEISAIGNSAEKSSKQLDKLHDAMGTAGAKGLASSATSSTGKMVRDFILMERAGGTGLRSLAGGFGLVATSAAAAGLAIGGVVTVARKVTELGKLGGESLTVKASFEQMMRSVGVATSELQQMQVAAGGTISTLKLLELANYSVIGVTGQVGQAIGQANDQLITIARAAFKARPSLQSVEFAYQSLVDGIKRVEKRLVDNLGLQVKAREANEKYAAAVGKSVDELTAEEVQLAFLNEVLRAGNILIGQVGGSVETMNDAFSRAEAATTNLKVALGEKLAPAVVELTNRWANLLNTLARGIGGPADAFGFTQQVLLAEMELEGLQQKLQEVNDPQSRAVIAGQIQSLTREYEQQKNDLVQFFTEQAQASDNTREAQERLNFSLLNNAIGIREYSLASQALAENTGVSKTAVDNLIDAVLRGKVSWFEFADALDRIESSAITASGKLGTFAVAISQAALAAYKASPALDAFNYALGRLSNTSLPYDDVIKGAREYANAIAKIEKQREAGVPQTVINDQLRDARRAFDIVTQGVDAYGDALSALGASGISLQEATERAKEFAEATALLYEKFKSGAIDESELNFNLAQLKYNLQETRKEFRGAANDVDDFTSALSGLVSSNLSASFTVEGLAPELSVREDEVDEHYRRLAAIALRGQEEMDKHQTDWADTLALIPEDVKAQGIEAMQAWAKDKVLAYDKGLDFSLINRDTLKKRIMDALLAQEMKKQLVDEITAELGGAVSQAQVSAAASMALGGTPLGQITLGGVTFGPAEPAPDMSAVGSQLATAVNQAFGDSVDQIQAVQMTAQHILSSNTQPIYDAGLVIGQRYVKAISDAAANGSTDIINKLANAIAPSVARILDANRQRSGGAQSGVN